MFLCSVCNQGFRHLSDLKLHFNCASSSIAGAKHCWQRCQDALHHLGSTAAATLSSSPMPLCSRSKPPSTSSKDVASNSNTGKPDEQHNDTERKQCPYCCSQVLSTLHEIHTETLCKQAPIICQICSVVVKKVSIKEHVLKLHSTPENPRFVCTDCGATYNVKSSLRSHRIRKNPCTESLRIAHEQASLTIDITEISDDNSVSSLINSGCAFARKERVAVAAAAATKRSVFQELKPKDNSILKRQKIVISDVQDCASNTSSPSSINASKIPSKNKHFTHTKSSPKDDFCVKSVSSSSDVKTHLSALVAAASSLASVSGNDTTTYTRANREGKDLHTMADGAASERIALKGCYELCRPVSSSSPSRMMRRDSIEYHYDAGIDDDDDDEDDDEDDDDDDDEDSDNEGYEKDNVIGETSNKESRKSFDIGCEKHLANCKQELHNVTNISGFTSTPPCAKRRKNSGDKVEKIRCEICSRQLNKGSLKEHMRLHSDEKPFECDKCHRRFKQKSGLRWHLNGRRNSGKIPCKGLRNIHHDSLHEFCVKVEAEFSSLSPFARLANASGSQSVFTVSTAPRSRRITFIFGDKHIEQTPIKSSIVPATVFTPLPSTSHTSPSLHCRLPSSISSNVAVPTPARPSLIQFASYPSSSILTPSSLPFATLGLSPAMSPAMLSSADSGTARSARRKKRTCTDTESTPEHGFSSSCSAFVPVGVSNPPPFGLTDSPMRIDTKPAPTILSPTPIDTLSHVSKHTNMCNDANDVNRASNDLTQRTRNTAHTSSSNTTKDVIITSCRKSKVHQICKNNTAFDSTIVSCAQPRAIQMKKGISTSSQTPTELFQAVVRSGDTAGSPATSSPAAAAAAAKSVSMPMVRSKTIEIGERALMSNASSSSSSSSASSSSSSSSLSAGCLATTATATALNNGRGGDGGGVGQGPVLALLCEHAKEARTSASQPATAEPIVDDDEKALTKSVSDNAHTVAATATATAAAATSSTTNMHIETSWSQSPMSLRT